MCRVHEEVQCTADVVGRRWLYAQKCGQVRYPSSCQNSSQYTCVTDSKEYLYRTLVYTVQSYRTFFRLWAYETSLCCEDELGKIFKKNI